MQKTKEMLAILEQGDEPTKLTKIKEKLQIYSERTARIVLHILETSPQKYEQKIVKEINKLEDKLEKEYRKLQKKLDSYVNEFGNVDRHKVTELSLAIEEMKHLL